MSRRVVLVVAHVFLVLHPQWRLATLTLLLQSFLVIQRQLLPFTSPLENALETGSLLVLTFIAVVLVGDTSIALFVGSPYSQKALAAVTVLVLVPVLSMLSLWAISIASRVPCIDRMLASHAPGLHRLIKPSQSQSDKNGSGAAEQSGLELQVQPAGCQAVLSTVKCSRLHRPTRRRSLSCLRRLWLWQSQQQETFQTSSMMSCR